MNDLISVIVPIYNVEAYLDECIGSICDQTYENTEIILIDDGSTDNSGKIADNWAKKDARCTVYHKKNEGLSAARNDGIKTAQGTYLIFVDSDDLIEKNMIERLYQEVIKEQVDIVCCGIKRRCEDNDYIKKYEVSSRIYTFPEYLYEMYSQENGRGDNDMFLPLVVAWNKIYKAILFEEIQYPIGKVCEDNAIIHRIVYKAKNVKWINEPLYIYRERSGSIMQSSFSIKKIDDFYAQMDRVQFVQDKINNLELMDMIVARCLDTGRRYWCKICFMNVWSKEQEEKTFMDINDIFCKYVTSNTFSLSKKIVWFTFLRMRGFYMMLWRLAHKIKKC